MTVVDTKNPGWGKPLLEKIQSVTQKPVVRIINTHTHGNHVSGNVDFPERWTAAAGKHKAGMENMKPVTGLAAPPPGPSIFQQNGGRGLPKNTFKDTMTIGKGPDEINLSTSARPHRRRRLRGVPRVERLHAGDAFHTRDLPIMDKNNGGSGVEYSGTLAKAAAQSKGIDTIINGHNATTTTVGGPADAVRVHRGLREVRPGRQEGWQDR